MKRLFPTLPAFSLLLLAVLLITGCSSPTPPPPASPIGLWDATTSLTTLELTPPGDAKMTQAGVTLTGKYTVLEDKTHVKLDFEFEPGKSTVLYAVISGDTLSFVNLQGKRVRFTKRS